jgi:excisionase family DNA binding protein
MKIDNPKSTPPAVTPLALRPVDAAKALGISDRTLWTWTRENLVPHVRIGNVVLYPIDDLQRWLNAKSMLPTVTGK